MFDTWKNGIIISADPEAEAAAAARLDPQVRSLLEANKPEALEELLLSRISEAPHNLRFFVPVVRHFVKNKNSETAQMFLDFLLEALRTRKAIREERSLLRALLLAWPEATSVRTILLEQLRALYGDPQNFKKLAGHCRVLEAPGALQAFRKLEYWLRFNEGQGVYLAARGAGRVKEINLPLDTLRVVFPDSTAPLSFKTDEAVRLLEPLRPGHFLLDKLDHPAELQQLAASDGRECIRRLFASFNRPLPLAELRVILSGIVNDAKWGTWWPEVRKDRRLTVSTGNVCSWNDSAEDADAELLRIFMAASVRDRLEMLRKHGKRSSMLAAAMTAELLKNARDERMHNPALAFELFLMLASEKDACTEVLAEFISHTDITEFIRNVEDRSLRKQAFSLIRKCRQDWPMLYIRLIKAESDMPSLGLLYEAVRGNNSSLTDELAAETMSAPAKTVSFFIWLCRELTVRPELARFADWSFLQCIMKLLANNSMKEHHASLRRLFDEDGAFHQTARRIDPDQAVQLIAQLERDTSLEDYRRNAMLKDLRAWYPQAEENKEKTFYVSARALKAKQEEFTRLTTVDIPQNTGEIIKARAHGDLRENFEYHAARARQEMLSSRAKTLHDELQFARPIDASKVDPATVTIGASVRLAELDGKESLTITILGPWDSDPARNIFSYLAPAVAEGLLGRRTGDRVTFNGKSFSITEISAAALL